METTEFKTANNLLATYLHQKNYKFHTDMIDGNYVWVFPYTFDMWPTLQRFIKEFYNEKNSRS